MTQFIELINTVLIELGKKFECTKDNFKDKSFNDYKDAINEANREICGLDEWPFMINEVVLVHEPGKYYLDIPQEISGTLKTVLFANNELEYTEDPAVIYNGEVRYFSIDNGMLKLPMTHAHIEVKIQYITS